MCAQNADSSSHITCAVSQARPKISLWIPSRGRRTEIRRPLDSLSRSKLISSRSPAYVLGGQNYQVWADPSIILLNEQNDDWNMGSAYNSIAAKTRDLDTEFFMVLEDDCVIYEATVYYLLKAMEDPKIGIATALGNYSRLFFKGIDKQLKENVPQRMIRSLGVMLIRTKLIDQIGGFAPSFFRCDSDFMIRANLAGYKTVGVPAAVCRHNRLDHGGVIESAGYTGNSREFYALCVRKESALALSRRWRAYHHFFKKTRDNRIMIDWDALDQCVGRHNAARAIERQWVEPK